MDQGLVTGWQTPDQPSQILMQAGIGFREADMAGEPLQR